jgi:hypothetical protein
MADYKVWRTVLQIHENDHKQAELIVAAKSRAAAARAFGCSDYDLKNFGSETGNDVQIAVAMAAAGTVFYKPLNDVSDAYRPRDGHTLSPVNVSDVAIAAQHAVALRNARASGKAIWRPYKYGQGATLRLPGGIIARAEWQKEGYRVTVGESALQRRPTGHREAKILAVAFARQLLNKALDALPDNPDLELPE